MSPALSMTAMFLLACAPPLDVSDASTSVVASATSPEATAACSDGGMTATTWTFDVTGKPRADRKTNFENCK
jgi:hypothetical protein